MSAPLIQKGEAEVAYSGFGSASDELKVATQQAKINAIESYISGQGQDLQAAYDQEARATLEENIDDYILSSTEIKAPVIDKKRDFVKVWLRVEINEARLNDLLRKTSNVADKRRSEKSKIAFVFVARQQQSVLSNEHQADEITFRAVQMDNIENTVKSTFVTKGFRVVSNTRMESRSGGKYSKARLTEQYANEASINWLAAERAAETLFNDFFIFGTFDIGLKQKDPVTGQFRIRVNADAEMIHLQEAETVAIPPTISVDALGRTETAAITNALKQAAQQVADYMVAQLYAQGYY